MSAMHSAAACRLNGLTALRLEALRDGMVAAAELELHNVTDIGRDQVRHEEILRAAEHDSDRGVT